MIDPGASTYSIGIGLTNRCNYHCAHCYSRDGNYTDLSYHEILHALDRIPVNSVNFGTGESILSADFYRTIEMLAERNIKLGLTSNGYSIAQLPDQTIRKFHDVDISLDFGDSTENDIVRSPGSYDSALNAIRRLIGLGVEVSLVACMTNKNFSEFGILFEIVHSFEINLRVNIYRPVHNKNLSLTYDQFWSGIRYLFSYGNVLSCSEPIVNTVLQEERVRQICHCGRSSFRIRPAGDVVPCVYWGKSTLRLEDMSIERLQEDSQFLEIQTIPAFCEACEDLALCNGGCGGRRYYQDIRLPDPYCYRYQNREKPDLAFHVAPAPDLIHASYLCTIIMG